MEWVFQEICSRLSNILKNLLFIIGEMIGSKAKTNKTTEDMFWSLYDGFSHGYAVKSTNV